VPTTDLAVFCFQFVACTMAVLCLVRWYLLPALAPLPPRKQLEFLLLPFLIRFLGSSTLVSGVVGPDYSTACAQVATVLDPLSFALALTSLFALRAGSRWSLPLVVAFLAEALVFSVLLLWVDGPTGPIAELHAHWYVATVVVPILIVFQVLVLLTTARHWRVLWAAA